MSSYFDDASLVMIPSGYKTSKVYSVKPTSGDGDLTFTRSNDTATRVGPDGLIEKVRTNQYFKSTALTTSSIFATYNVSPTSLGTYPVYSDSLAYSFAITGTNQGFIFQVANDSNIRAVSVFLKDFGTLDLYWTGSAPLSYGATSEVVNGYTRYLVVVPSGANNLYFRPNGNAGTTTTVYATAPQIEYGDIATAYISNDTTSSAVSVGPVANVPRLDYLNSSCPRLLLEPQRQNVLTFSEQMDNAAWNKIQSSVTANAGTSPDGYTNADKFIPNTSNVIHFVTQTISSVSASWTYSIFAKAAGYDRLILNAFNTNYVGFNLTSGIVESSLGTGVTSANIENYGNGWYRCSITSTSTATGTSVAISVFNAAYTNGNTNPQFAGNGTDGILIYGAQLEAGAYATSYIPTLGAAVTRGADAASKTGISSLLGATEGVIFIEVGDVNNNNSTGAEVWYLEIRKDQNNSFGLSSGGGTPQPIRFVTKIAGTAVTEGEPAPFANSKIAIKYTSTQFKVFRNGALVLTANKSIGNYADIQFMEGASVNLSMILKQFLVFPTALSDADAIALTA